MTNILTPGYLRWDGTKYTTDPDIEIVGPVGPPGLQGIQGIQGPTGPTGPMGDVPGTRNLTAGTGLLGGGNLTADRTFSVNPNQSLTSVVAGTLKVNGAATGASLNLTSNITIGAPTAGFGEIRLPSLGKINFRNFTNTTDLIILTTDSSNNVVLGDTLNSNSLIFNVGSVSRLQVRVSAAPIWDLTSSSSLFTVPIIQFANTISSPSFNQADNPINSSTGQTLTIHSQNSTGTGTTHGGALIIASGTGNVAGTITLRAGSTDMLTINSNRLQVQSGKVVDFFDVATVTFGLGNFSLISGDGSGNITIGDTVTVGNLDAKCGGTLTLYGGTQPTLSLIGGGTVSYNTALSSVTLKQADNTTASATGAPFTIQAANATGSGTVTGGSLSVLGGSGTNGGNLTLASGSGSSVSGKIILKSGGINILTMGGGAPLLFNSSILSATTGTTTLSAFQQQTPLLTYSASLSGNITIDFTNVAGLWFLDIGGVTLNGHTISIKSGVATVTLTIPTGQTLFVIRTSGFNAISYC